MTGIHSQEDEPPLSARDFAGDSPVVVLAPHPGDESLGCGGLLATAFAHYGARVICMTDGAASHPGSPTWPAATLARRRREELNTAVCRLGGTDHDVIWLGHPDGALAGRNRQPIVQLIGQICRDIGAQRLFSASPLEAHPDHQATADIARRVQDLVADLSLYFYPVWSRWEDPELEKTHDAWRMLRVATVHHRRVKAWAIDAHASQLGRLVRDDPTGARLDPRMVQLFTLQDEIYFGVPRCTSP